MSAFSRTFRFRSGNGRRCAISLTVRSWVKPYKGSILRWFPIGSNTLSSPYHRPFRRATVEVLPRTHGRVEGCHFNDVALRA